MTYALTPRLANAAVVLEPLTAAHCADLAAAVAKDDVWRTWYARIPRPDQMAEEIRARGEKLAAGLMAPGRWSIQPRVEPLA